MINETTIEGRCVVLYGQPSSFCLIQPIDRRTQPLLADEFQTIEKEGNGQSFLFVGLLIDDWNSELTPWPEPPVFGNKPFLGQANETLDYLVHRLIPTLKSHFGLNENTSFIIGGYSLGGLFALWASTQTDVFKGVAAASPSVWYPKWLDFSIQNNVLAQTVYLSLGKQEPLTKNQVMAQSGFNIERLHQKLVEQLGEGKTTLVWNDGNHFNFPEIRTGMAYAWVLSVLRE